MTATIAIGWGSPPTLNDNPLSVGQTTVQARHITELRDAINALRSHMNMSAHSWQYSATTTDYISANPILEMRTALDQALGAPSGGYSTGLAQGQPVKAIHIQELRDRVLAAWTSGSSTQINWMVTDRLGTPRMVFDKTGSLSGVSRHDYLPFGEELYAGISGRTTQQGYTGDSVRQKFTLKERDNETGLDWFGPGRYYSSTQGRFTSVDPLGASAKPANPQTFNRYSYVWNRPTIAIDPDGLSTIVIIVSPRASGGSGMSTVSVYDRNGHDRNIHGRDTNIIVGSAIGGSTDRRQRGGDTPFGVYRIFQDPRANENGTQGGVAGQSAREGDRRFGTGIIYLQPVSGEVVDAGRSTIYLHGGGRPLDQALDDNQPLTRTEGCVRCGNADINALIGTVNDAAQDRDPVTNVFIGDNATINAQADQRDANGNYLYPELRNAGFGSADAQGRPPGNRPQPTPERERRFDEQDE